jgi:hypothetical protein
LTTGSSPDVPSARLRLSREVVMRTLSATVEDLARRGFTQHFGVAGGLLRALGTGQAFGPNEVAIREFHRFEGDSDPDDMAIVYAIEAVNGTRGTLVDAFGVYSNPAVSAFLDKVRFSGQLAESLSAQPAV